MSDAVQIALIVGLPPTIAALGVLWQNASNATAAREARAVQSVKLEEIHKATNGSLTEVKDMRTALEKELSVATERIRGLEAALGVAKAAAAIPPLEERH